MPSRATLVACALAAALAADFAAGCLPPAAPASAAAPFPLLTTAHDLDGRPVGGAGAPATIAVVFASWCGHCQDTFAMLAELRASHPGVHVVGVNWRGHEEYGDLGDDARLRAYVATAVPWLPVVAADDQLFVALGAPRTVPTVYVFDRGGALVARYDHRPAAADLGALLDELR